MKKDIIAQISHLLIHHEEEKRFSCCGLNGFKRVHKCIWHKDESSKEHQIQIRCKNYHKLIVNYSVLQSSTNSVAHKARTYL